MHELAITCGIVELVAEAAKGRNRSEAAAPEIG
jgi:Zn finger protein HypA/HybF involved in hydrogenase expression